MVNKSTKSYDLHSASELKQCVCVAEVNNLSQQLLRYKTLYLTIDEDDGNGDDEFESDHCPQRYLLIDINMKRSDYEGKCELVIDQG